MSTQERTALVATPRVVLVCDLAGFMRAFDTRRDAEMADLLEAYYARVGAAVEEGGGRVVKLIGDAVLVVFAPDAGATAVEVATRLEREIGELALERGVDVALGADIHLGEVLEGDLGWGELRRWDVVGRTVNRTFRLGRGSGVRVSEELCRAFPEEEQKSWREGSQPGAYVRSGPAPPERGSTSGVRR